MSAREIKRWERKLGSVTFLHVHHACYGFILRNRARMARTTQERNFNYERAFQELTYTYRRIPKEKSPILPKISREIAEIKDAQGKPWEAARYLNEAIRYQPKNVAAYREKANYFISREDYDQALQTLDLGLETLGGDNRIVLALMSSTALKAKDYEAATQYARRAYDAGYKGKRLKRLLEEAGHPL